MLAFAPGPFEIIVFCLIILLLFGKRLPGVMHSVGKSIVEFKKGTRDAENEDGTSGSGD